jgi:magnesium-dependent phosphatase 1
MASLIVFDLDLTLWHCGSALWCDQLDPPLYRSADGRVHSACRSEVRLFPDVPGLLDALSSGGFDLAIASRTDATDIAEELLELLGIARHFPTSHRQIYPGDKTAHFHALRDETGLAFDEMLFFDDEPRNIESVSRLGVTARLVHHGMTRTDLEAVMRW